MSTLFGAGFSTRVERLRHYLGLFRCRLWYLVTAFLVGQAMAFRQWRPRGLLFLHLTLGLGRGRCTHFLCRRRWPVPIAVIRE
ncbi:hypothetical protein NDU88_004106 [Pleurodeles waltl]|uniref:Uncharacterized protein n=1 Tax=Pleurodeles waltl TaxID=8319 RepID=A0AAV7UH55_PLEWA|nr:hypothetical protein NDU88_004106 [Pleurodeles waltl]